MSGRPPFSRAAAMHRHGAAGMEAVRRKVDAAPPLRPELREQIRAVFASACAMRRQPSAADSSSGEA
ncbi:hypothetical protein ACIRL0_00555 [Streptomyces sp. NPDC102365]|uniref:hypothetical protein n=1 Tax=Streptomyces sp. NPDC102365 TaxID=3366162 RepID=UPI00382A742E